ncbi:hypothetical protein SE17_26030, partial [Kouleothrix aurantiaca]
MTHTLVTVQGLLARAGTPADVFGPLASADTLRQRFRALILAAHPDHNPAASDAANAACHALNEWYAAAQRQLAAGVYGTAPRIRISSGPREYVGYAAPIAGELCDLFPAEADGGPVLLKAARH